MSETLPRNPFPGLRPFEADEDHLFFGREKEIDDLLRRLRFNRFLAVTGTSGCGKSSLVRSGLLPSLESGLMLQAGSSWRMAIMRPGEDPLGHLADALDEPAVLGDRAAETDATNRVMLEATLRRGTRGLIQAVRQAHLPDQDNVLVLVDQFEELFRFRRSHTDENSRDESVAFVKLLLEAVTQTEVPIYVVLTMRSDFIGDCMDYPGLPEALNESQFLVPRMTRDDLRSAIRGPVAVAGAEIAPRLVLRLLNDLGDDRDDLPLLQHALMRTWDHWAAHDSRQSPIDVPHYEAIGTLRRALSLHAEEAYAEVEPGQARRTTELIFRALTDTFTDPRGIRRPTAVSELAAICAVSEADVSRIVEIFRKPGRSFLTPPVSVPLASGVVVDLSHESLLRCWTRLIEWAQAERTSAAIYHRLAREAAWFEEGAAGLWGDPELELGLQWRKTNQPTAAWARRYNDTFDRATDFLDRSEQERARQRAERRAARVRRLVFAWGTSAVLLVMSGVLLVLFMAASRQRARAEQNLQIAADAVDKLLVSIDRDPATIGADIPAMQELRRQLLTRAKPFYDQFLQQNPSDTFVSGQAHAHLRLGHIQRMLNDPALALAEYGRAITAFGDLAARNPAQPEYRRMLASAENWRGETLRTTPDSAEAAEAAYGRALELQQTLVRDAPGLVLYQQDAARTHYNRGILFGSTASPGEPQFARSEADFREAIRILEPLVGPGSDLQLTQDLARAVNNLASLVGGDAARLREAQPLYERAILLHERLVQQQPDIRQYKIELAKFCNNLAELNRQTGHTDEADDRTQRALTLLDDLALPAPSLGIEQADTHNLRGHILETRDQSLALMEYRQAFSAYHALLRTPGLVQLAEFHLRYGDLLHNLALFARDRPTLDGLKDLLTVAVSTYVSLGVRASEAGLTTSAASVDRTLTDIEPDLSARDRPMVASLADPLRQQIRRTP